MNAPDFLCDLATSNVRLELIGDMIKVSDSSKLTEEQRLALTEHRGEILLHLRVQEHSRLAAAARKLGDWLDDLAIDYTERKARVPEYQALLDQIAELQVYVDTAGVADSAASAAITASGGSP